MACVATSKREYCYSTLGTVSRKSRGLFGPEKQFVKLRPAYSVKLIFSLVVKWIKIKITAKFRASRRLRFEDTKRVMSPEIRPKSFGTFEKQVPGQDASLSQCVTGPIFTPGWRETTWIFLWVTHVWLCLNSITTLWRSLSDVFSC